MKLAFIQEVCFSKKQMFVKILSPDVNKSAFAFYFNFRKSQQVCMWFNQFERRIVINVT